MTRAGRVFTLALLLVASPCLAQQRPPASNAPQTPAQQAAQEAVDAILKEYSAYFSELPPSRKCTPADAHGIWKEYAIYESGNPKLVNEQKANGPKYLVFGTQYNQLLWVRNKNPVNAAGALTYANRSKTQYIMTTAGMFYIYEAGQLKQSLICSVSTAKTAKYEKDMLMLALPVEKDKSLTVSLYAAFK